MILRSRWSWRCPIGAFARCRSVATAPRPSSESARAEEKLRGTFPRPSPTDAREKTVASRPGEPSRPIRRQTRLRRAEDLGRQPGVGHHARHRYRADHRRCRTRLLVRLHSGQYDAASSIGAKLITPASTLERTMLCRNYKTRKKEARRPHSLRRPIRAIAKELGTTVEIAKGWVSETNR